MIASVQGKITYKSPTFIYIETGGIGYHVNITLNTYSRIEKLEEVKLFTHLHVKEDSHTLYGFSEWEERDLFVHLISVSGIGPNTARIILSGMTSEEARNAVLAEDELAFKQIKGIGSKTAKQIILDLKNKLAKGKDPILIPPSKNNTMHEEALSGLLALGFQRNKILRAIAQVSRTNPEIDRVEALIKASLKHLSS